MEQDAVATLQQHGLPISRPSRHIPMTPRRASADPSPSSVLGLPVVPHSSRAVIEFDGAEARRLGNSCLYGWWTCPDPEETEVVAAAMRNGGWIRWSVGWDAAARRGSAFGGRRWGIEFYLCVGVSSMLTGQCVSLFCTYSVATSDRSWKLNKMDDKAELTIVEDFDNRP